MKRYPAWQALFRCFFSSDFYRDVATNWKGLGFLYLSLLAGVSSLVFALIAFVTIAGICDRHLLPIADQFPTITSADDKFSIDRPSPYYIKDDLFPFTFDTSGNTTTLDNVGVLITDKDILFRQRSPNPVSADREETEGSATKSVLKASSTKGVFSKTDARSFVLILRNYVPIALFFIAWINGTIFVIVQALIYGLFGLIFNSILKTKLSFIQLTRIAAVAMTPPLLADITLKVVYPMFQPVGWACSFIVSMIYLFIGVRACKTLLCATDSPFPSAPHEAPVSEPLHSPNSTDSPGTTAQPEQTEVTTDTAEQPPSQPGPQV